MKHDYSLDRKLMRELVKALDIVRKKGGKSIIQKDECGDYTIYGKTGKIFTDGQYWYIYTGGSKREWTFTKQKLSFMILRQDGDEEGILRLDRMPTKEEAEKVREVIGITKRSKRPGNITNLLGKNPPSN